MRNRFKIILWVIFILILIFLLVLISINLDMGSKSPEYKIIDNITDYNYTLEERDPIIMQEVFDNLKNVLDKDPINKEQYAEYLSKLFIIDLFTLNNKNNKYDVGGIEYVVLESQENYRLNVEDTLYKYIIDINSEEREELPVVKSINKESIEEITYIYKEEEYEAYKIILTWDYENDFDYDKKGEIVLINKDNKLYVTSYKGVE